MKTNETPTNEKKSNNSTLKLVTKLWKEKILYTNHDIQKERSRKQTGCIKESNKNVKVNQITQKFCRELRKRN